MQVEEFICNVYESKSLYGLQPETLDSLILNMLPSSHFKFIKLTEENIIQMNEQDEIPVFLLRLILSSLKINAGFNITMVSAS